MVGNGLIGVLVGVRSELEGFDTNVTGLIMAAYFVGFLAGSPDRSFQTCRVRPTWRSRPDRPSCCGGATAAGATAATMGTARSKRWCQRARAVDRRRPASATANPISSASSSPGNR